MYKNKKIVAVIPARKGSKGVPNKNIKELNGIPLVAHSIKQAKDSIYIDKVIVSTDSEEIYRIAKDYDVDISGLRPAKLSDDTAIIYDVIKYEILNHKLVENKFDLLVLLQPTSPLRKSCMIDGAIERFIEEDQISAVSISQVEEHPIFMRTIGESGKLEKVLNIESTIRRQDLPDYYRVNGMIYINRIEDLLKEYISLNDNKSPIIIPKEYDVDIDSISDFAEAERRLESFDENNSITENE